MSLNDAVGALAEESNFSGVVSVTRRSEEVVSLARGYAHRAHQRPNEAGTMFATASATKGLTALGTVSLIESGHLDFDTTFESLMGNELPLVDSSVTIEHLLSHTSGIGDYLDEDAVDDIDAYVLSVAPHLLSAPRAYLPMLQGHPQQTPPGTAFAYNNGGYMLLSLAVEAASRQGFHDLLEQRVLAPAGMVDSGFLRSDDLPARAAQGYLKDGRTNVFNLPIMGAGDGGIYSTLADWARFWKALFDGSIVSSEMVDLMVHPRNKTSNGNLAYGLGFWLQPDTGAVALEGMDAGVSFRSVHEPVSDVTYTVMSNTSTDAWPLVRYLDSQLADLIR